MASRLTTKASKTEAPEEFQPEPQRYPTPPPHLTHPSRGIHTPLFSSFQPRDLRFTSTRPFSSVAWSCDGRRLASVGIDRAVRLWTPEKNFDSRSATQCVGAHDYEPDYVTWNPTHPELFCSSSQRDKKIVFWDARQSRCVQSHVYHSYPTQVHYAPEGKLLCVVGTDANHPPSICFMAFDIGEGASKPSWSVVKRNTVGGTTACFSHGGNGLAVGSLRANQLIIQEYPSLSVLQSPAAHVGGCSALALDPRGLYLASGGSDSIVNMFDTTEWICVNTITSCEHSITSLSFSYDGEYLAIASQGPYIDICSSETCLPIHRVPILGPAPAVAWHPSKHVFACCGHQNREGSTQLAFLSLFGPGV